MTPKELTRPALVEPSMTDSQALVQSSQRAIAIAEQRLGVTSAGVLKHYLSGLSSGSSRDGMQRHARMVAEELFGLAGKARDHAPWIVLAARTFGPKGAAEYRANLAERVEARDKDPEDGLSRSAANARIAALRGVFRALWKLGAIKGEPRDRLLASTRSIPGQDRTKRPTVEVKEFVRLDIATEELGDNAARMVRAALALLSLGLRRSEVVGLRWEHRREVGGGLAFEVSGKGGTVRTIFIDEERDAVLASWREACGNSDAGHVLHPVTRSDKISEGPISANGLYKRINRTMLAAGIDERGLHAFRRMFASMALRELDPSTVAKLTGHRSLSTLLMYDVQREEELAARARSLGGGLFLGTQPSA